MTDTSGDTASGGMENDMPGIGNAPPSVNYVPSALGGLARILFGGRPAPPPPPPMPFGRMGSSQIPQMGGQPNQPRWSGTTASLFLPKGSDQPPANFTPFMKSLPREASMWGQSEPYPNLPQSHELPGMAQSLSKFFGQFGGGLSPVFALAMGRYAGDYMKGVMTGQEFLAKQALEKYKINALYTAAEEKERFRKYHETFDEYGVMGGSDQMAKLDHFMVGGVSLHDATLRTATETDDKPVIAMINDGADMGKVFDFLKLRDQQLQDLEKHNEKAAQQTEDDSIWEGGGGTDQPQHIDPYHPQPQAEPAASTQPATPAAPTSPGAPAPVMTAQNTQPGEVDPAAVQTTQPNPLSDAGDKPRDALVSDAVRDVLPSAEFAKKWPNEYARILSQSGKIKQQVKNIAMSRASPEQKMAAYKALDPQLANDVQQIGTYQRPLGGGQGGQGASPGSRAGQYSGLLADAIQGVYPNWNQAFYQDQRNFRENRQNENLLARADSMPVTGQQVLDDLDMFVKENHIDPQSFNWQMVMDKHLANDEIATKFFNDWGTYVFDVQQVLASGRALQGETFHIENINPSWTSVAGWRGAIKGHMTAAHSYLDGVIQNAKDIGMEFDPQTGRKTMPTFTFDALSHMDAIERINPVNGALPGDKVYLYNKRTQKHDIPAIYTGVNMNDWQAPENYIDPSQYRPRTRKWKRPTYDPND